MDAEQRNGRRWAVVGGGFIGMTLALRLSQRGHDVTLFEHDDHLGGLAAPWQVGPVTWDRFYHVTLQSDEYLRRLLREIQLDDAIVWAQTRTGCYADGHLFSVSNTVEFLRFPLLSAFNRLRLGTTVLAASRIKNWRRLETQHVEQWLTFWSGRRTFETFWRPLLRAKLGDNYQRTSAAFIWAVMQRLYAARRSGMKKEQFGYVPGGYDRIVSRLTDHLHQRIDVRTSTDVVRIDRDSGAVDVTVGSGETHQFDEVVVTTPNPVIERVVVGLDAVERARFAQIEYQGVICASLLLRRPLAGFYLTNIIDDLPFTGVVEMTALVDPAELNGYTLVYLPRYTHSGDPMLRLADADIEALFVDALIGMHPRLKRTDIVTCRVARAPHVLPLPVINFSQLVPPVRTSVDGVYVVNSSQIVNGTLNVNEVVRLAEHALETLTTGDQAPARRQPAPAVRP